MNILKKIIIYSLIAILVFIISGDALVIRAYGFSPYAIMRLALWVGLIALLLYFDGKLFAKKADEEIKYTKTKSNIILIVSSVAIILIFGLLILE